jgi:hypothetical protein
MAVITVLPAVALAFLLLHGRMAQDEVLPDYHNFADQRTVWSVPNFWNVATNLLFLSVALWGSRALGSGTAFVEKWERTAYSILLIAVALIAVGSAYYHLWPTHATLFWDRLPMAVVFMGLLATTVGERISAQAGRLLLFPLLATGVVSVLYWRVSDDLRFYALVQFCAVVVLPLIVILFPPRYTGTAGLVAMIGLYGLALGLDHYDRRIGALITTGGHPWKHVAAAFAMFCYVSTVARRVPLSAGPAHLRSC